jgi:superfamily II DNA or RNA helicase
MTAGYAEFLASKRVAAPAVGFGVAPEDLNPALFPWQREIVAWQLGLGRGALFSDTGTGKTRMQLEWARLVHERTGGDVLVLAPLAVGAQTALEGERIGVEVHRCSTADDVRPGVNVTNYERLSAFDPFRFAGAVLDESSILKSFMGKTKRALIRAFAETPHRLAATATPAPNDHVEIGNHSEFLGVMPGTEMLMRWFANDTMNAGRWRLKGHAERDFWRWVASWAVALRRPSDLGYPDDGFDLPPLRLEKVVVPVDRTEDSGERLFREVSMSATDMHREMRLTAPARAAKAAELANDLEPGEAWCLWCNTNREADLLKAAIPDAVEVRGSDPPEEKEAKLLAFSRGDERVMVTKPSIAGFGLNWQHCRNTAFVGLSHSFEQFYQAVRRFYRFGQTREVRAYVVIAETEGDVLSNVKRKMAEHERLLDGMRSAFSDAGLAGASRLSLAAYEPSEEMRLPDWLSAQERLTA